MSCVWLSVVRTLTLPPPAASCEQGVTPNGFRQDFDVVTGCVLFSASCLLFGAGNESRHVVKCDHKSNDYYCHGSLFVKLGNNATLHHLDSVTEEQVEDRC